MPQAAGTKEERAGSAIERPLSRGWRRSNGTRSEAMTGPKRKCRNAGDLFSRSARQTHQPRMDLDAELIQIRIQYVSWKIRNTGPENTRSKEVFIVGRARHIRWLPIHQGHNQGDKFEQGRRDPPGSAG